MIKGILTFKPLASGEVQILIKGNKDDIAELARLYGQEVTIEKHTDKAEVQSPLIPAMKEVLVNVDNLREALLQIINDEMGRGKE